jgi:hypothetical protein
MKQVASKQNNRRDNLKSRAVTRSCCSWFVLALVVWPSSPASRLSPRTVVAFQELVSVRCVKVAERYEFPWQQYSTPERQETGTSTSQLAWLPASNDHLHEIRYSTVFPFRPGTSEILLIRCFQGLIFLFPCFIFRRKVRIWPRHSSGG